MYNLDKLLSYLLFITIITFIFERIIENLLIPFLPSLADWSISVAEEKKLSAREVAAAGISAKKRRTLLILILMYGIGLGLALTDPRFRLFAGGLDMPVPLIVDSIFSAALIAGGSQPLHSLVEKVRRK